MKKWIFLIILFISTGYLVAQQPPGTDGHVWTTKGGEVKFQMENMRSIMEGMTYTDYLELSITYCDSNYITTGWELYVYSAYAEFQAEMNTVPTIPLDVITISSRMENGTDIAVDEQLSQTPLLVGEGLPPFGPDKCVQDKVILSFSCASLVGYSFDFYRTSLQFELKTKN